LSHSLLGQEKASEVIALSDEWSARMSSPIYANELAYNRGVADFKLKRFDEASDILNQYGRGHPDDASCALMTGLAAANAGRSDLAERELLRYLRLAPGANDRPYVLSVLQDVQRRGQQPAGANGLDDRDASP